MAVIKFLMAEKYKPREIYRKMCYVYVEAFISQKSLQTGLELVGHY